MRYCLLYSIIHVIRSTQALRRSFQNHSSAMSVDGGCVRRALTLVDDFFRGSCDPKKLGFFKKSMNWELHLELVDRLSTNQ